MANGSIFLWTVFLYYAKRKVLKFIYDIAITLIKLNEILSYHACYKIDLFINRCDHFEPSDYWTDYNGRPFGGNIDSEYCDASQANEGAGEKFCQIRCNRDGSCSESVRQHKCSCPDYDDGDYHEAEFESTCATVEYKVKKFIITTYCVGFEIH